MSKLPKDVAIRVADVHKDFHLPHHNEDSIKRRVTQMFKKKDKTVDVHHALKGVTFDIKKGEFFGIVGRNGSGKSTLLKIISEIYQPTSGYAQTQGKVVAFIELGVGFNPQLSGRENVFLNGAMLGFSRQEMREMYDEIVAFAELEEFMDQKLKNYSSGMKVRLAFSVAIRAQADILILDEVLAVGDKSFQDKCYQYFKDLKEAHKTIVLVSHSMNLIEQYCDKAILIDDGKVTFTGLGGETADAYTELFNKDSSTNEVSHENSRLDKVTTKIRYSEDYIYVDLFMEPTERLDKPVIAVLINKKGRRVYRWVSDEGTEETIDLIKDSMFKASLRLQNIFPAGEYTVDVTVKRDDRGAVYGVYNNISSFQVVNNSSYRHKVFWRPDEKFTIEGMQKKVE